jgi:hypothetical protein
LRKTAAIFFLSVLCFNCLGYRYVFDYLQHQHDRQFEARLDEDDYDESSLVSIKTAFSVPYYYITNSDKYERWKGEIEINGVQYKYVKRRFFNDSIELLCIPNATATKLKEAEQNFYRLSNDLQSGQQGKKQDAGQLPAFKNLLSEYCEAIPDWDAGITGVQQAYYSFYNLLLPQYTADSPGQPPDVTV